MLFISITIALAAAFVLWRAKSHEIRAEQDFPPIGDFVTVDGKRVHYLIKGSGPDVVLIHGSSGNLRDMNFGLMDALASTHRVIAFDRAGLGYSAPLDAPSISAQADILAKAAAQLDAPRPNVVGHSYGGAVALAWAVNHPDRLSALTLLASPIYPWDTPLDPLYRVTSKPVIGDIAIMLLTAFVPGSYVKTAAESVFAPQSAPEGYADYIGGALTLRRVSMKATAIQRAKLLDEITALAPRYDQIKVPIELLHGDSDDIVNLSIHSERMASELEHADLTTLPGAGHMPQHTHMSDVISTVTRASNRAAQDTE